MKKWPEKGNQMQNIHIQKQSNNLKVTTPFKNDSWILCIANISFTKW